MRLLDVGCGWGGMLLHAAEHHGVRGGRASRSPVRRPSWRASGPPSAASATASRCASPTSATSTTVRTTPSARSACSSTSGLSELDALLPPLPRAAAAARAGCSTTASAVRTTPGKMHHHRWAPPTLGRNFTERYVFPDGELHEIGNVVSAIQRAGFEARHMESLREHYALTLRCWVRNLEAHWDDAVAEVGPGPGARVAPLHGGGRGGLRARRQPGPPGARHRHHRRRQRHAPPAPVHLTFARPRAR